MGLKSLWLVSVCCYADYWDAMNSTLLDSCAEAVTNRKIWLIGQHDMHICYPKEKYYRGDTLSLKVTCFSFNLAHICLPKTCHKLEFWLCHRIHQSVTEHHEKSHTVCVPAENTRAPDLTCLSHFQSLVFPCPQCP